MTAEGITTNRITNGKILDQRFSWDALGMMQQLGIVPALGQAECPKCHSRKLTPQLSVFAVSAKGSAASATPTGARSTCGDPRGPASCSMPDLDSALKYPFRRNVGK